MPSSGKAGLSTARPPLPYETPANVTKKQGLLKNKKLSIDKQRDMTTKESPMITPENKENVAGGDNDTSFDYNHYYNNSYSATETPAANSNNVGCNTAPPTDYATCKGDGLLLLDEDEDDDKSEEEPNTSLLSMKSHRSSFLSPHVNVGFHKVQEKTVKKNNVSVDNDAGIPKNFNKKLAPTTKAASQLVPEERRGGNVASPVSALHSICIQNNATSNQFENVLQKAKGTIDASKVDEYGRLPLHLIGNNERLILSFIQQSKDMMNNTSCYSSSTRVRGLPPTPDLDNFVLSLVKSYRHGIISVDNDGHIPFTKCLYDWVGLSAQGLDLSVAPGCDDNNDVGNNNNGNIHNEKVNVDPAKALDDLIADAIATGNGGAKNDNNDNNTSNNRNVNINNIEQMVVEAPNFNHHERSRRGDDDGTIGSRSLLSNITNITMPTAFKSIYTPSSKALVDGELGGGAATRALYRSRDNEATPTQFNNDSHDIENGCGRNKSRSSDINANSTNQRPNTPAGTRMSDFFFVREDRSLDSISSAPDGLDNEVGFDDVFPSNIKVPPVVEWSLNMLSTIVDYFESGSDTYIQGDHLEEEGTLLGMWQAQQRENTHGIVTTPAASDLAFARNRNIHSPEWIAKTLVSAVSSIQSLMKTLLLLDDNDPVKARLFNLTLVKRMVYNPQTIGNWLVYMLEAVDSNVAERGVQYIEMLSSDSESSDSSVFPTAEKKGLPSPRQRTRLYKKVARLDYLLPAVLALEDKGHVDRVAKTHLMSHIENIELTQTPTILMAFFDFLFNVMLLVSFMVQTNYFLEGAVYGYRYLATFYIGLACIIYRVSWNLAQMVSMIKISRSAFISNSFRGGDWLISWPATFLALGGLVWMELRIDGEKYEANYERDEWIRSYLAVTVGMLWLALLRWFYIVNWSFSMFFNMLKQVVLDMRVFFFVFTATILTFSQMFYVILFKNKEECGGEGFCDPKDVYLQVYSIVLGQFNLEDFTSTFSIVLFVIFTALVAFILLYVLIAVVLEAHSKFIAARLTTTRPKHASRSRLVYVMHLRAFRRMVEQPWNFMQYVAVLLFISSTGLISVLCLRNIRENFDSIYGTLALSLIFGFATVFLLFGVLTFVSHMTYFDLTETCTNRPRTACMRLTGCCVFKALIWPIRVLTSFFVGVPPEASTSPIPKKKGEVAHLHNDFERMIDSTQNETKMLLLEELTTMEGRMKYSSNRNKVELEMKERMDRMEKMVENIHSLLMHGQVKSQNNGLLDLKKTITADTCDSSDASAQGSVPTVQALDGVHPPDSATI